VLVQQRTNVRNDFYRRHPNRNGRRGVPYPPWMEEILYFAKWFEEEVENTV